ncbi:two component transcriptional regulator, winged helix family protein [Fulvimarina pelagi HTCC2506]|uniref:Regulatory protein VirG n=1 Tax=Fulvimarina pelagi HTCC2506 TaxID=314231 RepID=Q0G6J8_9HYPH|nr:response regulator [Fulvimarina pelagi]EAU42716.1 two component transcriptional regulator, winged helix family protein [Fulvimarina pelagi HTCC2506]
MSEPLIFVVDDDPETRSMIADYLAMNGYSVCAFEGAAALREALGDRHPDLIVLDLNMPGEDGLSLVRYLKTDTGIPVVMLTATASLVDRVVGLELGADDYLAKPCELRELLARIRAVMRRSSNIVAPPAQAQADLASDTPRREIRFGTKWLDLDAQTLRDDEGVELQLVQSEFGLLKAFAENPRRVLSRERLLDIASARDSDPFDRAIDVRITRIRKKVEPDPAHPTVIRTVRGAGYLFSPDR